MRFNEILKESANQLDEAAAPVFGTTEYSNFAELKKAIEATWGKIATLDRERVSSNGSSMGFTLGRSHLINPKNKKVVGFWETTGASNEPGRGTVTRGYGAVAQKPVRKAAVPKVPKVAAAKKPAGAAEISNVLIKLMASMKSKDRTADYTGIEGNRFEVRNWGRWEIPYDAPEDDREDYDWKVISDESEADLKAIQNKIAAEYPNVKIDIQGSEKEWLTIQVSSKL
jgi:hypothetical protein